MTRNRFQCPACGTLTNSLRCPQCGTDTQDCDERPDLPTREPIRRAYTIFDHAQAGHIRSRDPRNVLAVAHGKAQRRRFTDSTVTAFATL